MSAQFHVFGPYFVNGQLVTSPRLYHYMPGTTQEQEAWTDYAQQISAANPIEGDANGLVWGYFDGLYKIEVWNATETTLVARWDNVNLTDPNSIAAQNLLEGTLDLSDFDSVSAALSDIGTSDPQTLLVHENITITTTVNLGGYPNITFLFVGAGRFTVASGGIELALHSPGQIRASPTQFVLDATNGTIRFVFGGEFLIFPAAVWI